MANPSTLTPTSAVNGAASNGLPDPDAPRIEGSEAVSGRLLCVSNRLPITITKSDNGWKFAMSSGGLVSALSGLKKQMSFTWIGWPGWRHKD